MLILVARWLRYLDTSKNYSDFNGSVECCLASVAMRSSAVPKHFPLVTYVFFCVHIGLNANSSCWCVAFSVSLFLMCMVRKIMVFLRVSWIIPSGVLRQILVSSFLEYFLQIFNFKIQFFVCLLWRVIACFVSILLCHVIFSIFGQFLIFVVIFNW